MIKPHIRKSAMRPGWYVCGDNYGTRNNGRIVLYGFEYGRTPTEALENYMWAVALRKKRQARFG